MMGISVVAFRCQGKEWLPDEDDVDPLADELVEDIVEMVGGRVGADIDDDGMSGNIAELAKATCESVLPAGFGRFVGEAYVANSRHLPRHLGAGSKRRGKKEEHKREAAEMPERWLGSWLLDHWSARYRERH